MTDPLEAWHAALSVSKQRASGAVALRAPAER
jgi:hypothetical protein